MTSTSSIWGDQIDGRNVCDRRSVSMTVIEPPSKYRWHNRDCNHGSGDDDTRTEISLRTEEEWRERRLMWLDQFDLEISLEPEHGFRVWRWLGDDTAAPSGYNDRSGRRRQVRWSERRPWDGPLPTTPGLWPSDE